MTCCYPKNCSLKYQALLQQSTPALIGQIKLMYTVENGYSTATNSSVKITYLPYSLQKRRSLQVNNRYRQKEGKKQVDCSNFLFSLDGKNFSNQTSGE